MNETSADSCQWDLHICRWSIYTRWQQQAVIRSAMLRVVWVFGNPGPKDEQGDAAALLIGRGCY